MRKLSFCAAVSAAAIIVVALGASVVRTADSQSATSKTPALSAASLAVKMPPLPNPGYPPGRPVEVARAAYTFAAEHPEILKYVPCYCGCESGGHNHNESCFVKRRDAKGNVLEWDTHGYG